MELEAGFEARENLTSLTNVPWVAHGLFEDQILSAQARKVNQAAHRLKVQERKTAALRAQHQSVRSLVVFENSLADEDSK